MIFDPIPIGATVEPLTPAGLVLRPSCPKNYYDRDFDYSRQIVLVGTGTVLARRRVTFNYPADSVFPKGLSLRIWHYKIKCSNGIGWGSGVRESDT